MKMRLALSFLLVSFILAACGGGGGGEAPRAVPTAPSTNDDGTVVTSILTAQFDTANPDTLPLPNNLLFLGPPEEFDLTLNLPVTGTFLDGTFAALSAMDGFSTVAPWAAPFVGLDGAATTIDPATVVHGSTVRVFEVTTVFGTIAPNGIVRELVPGADYIATVSGGQSVAIVPTRPLKELTVYMAVLTDDIRDTSGSDATPDQTYFIAKRTSPLVDANGNSTDSLLDDATAQALEGLRQIVNAQEAVAGAAGIPKDDIVLSWTLTTQSITPILSAIRSIVQPAPITTAPLPGVTTAAVGGFGLADVHIGILTLPYYLGRPTAANPTAPLTEFWEAAPGAYLPGVLDLLPTLSPTSTNITVVNPFPVTKSMETIPLMLTVPNTGPKPAAGWPVVIYQSGITRNRTDVLAIADTLASVGYAVFSIDQPLHGVVPDVEPHLAGFYIENTPFGAVAQERTFDVDYVNNATGAAGRDGFGDAGGSHTINLTSLRTARDNLRQASVDLSVLASTIFNGVDITGDGVPDFDTSNIQFVGHSLGGIIGTSFLAVEPLVTHAVLPNIGGGIAGLLLGSQSFGPRILAGLAGLGLEPGSTNFNLFILATQTLVDSADPINWAATAASRNTILLQEAIGDATVPNFVPGFPMAGTDPLIAAMGLTTVTTTTTDPLGLRVAVQFSAPAGHSSFLSPAASPAATAEIQRQMASMVASFGTTLVVSDPSVIETE